MALPLRSLRLTAFPSQTLDSTSGETGEIYYDKNSQTVRLFTGAQRGGFVVATRVWVQNNLNTVSQPMTLTDTTNSSSTSTGSLKVFGGAGIAKNLYVGQQLNVAGASTLQSTLAVTDDVTVGANKFTVDAQTGNTAVAGTLNVVSDFNINTNKLMVAPSTGNTIIAGTLSLGDSLTVNTDKFTVNSGSGAVTTKGNITADGELRITSATAMILRATGTNSRIDLIPDGTGYVKISGTNAIVIPSGTSEQQGPAVNGAIRLNTTYGQFEGYAGGNWSSLGGVRSVDGQTYIIAETSPNASDDTLHFYAANSEVATLNATKLDVLQTTVSSSITTGALTVAGGVGISGNLWVGGNLNLAGTETTVGGVTFKEGLTLSGSETSATEYFRITNGATSPITKFLVDTANGNTTVSGTADVTGDFKVNTNKFTVAASTGNTLVAGTLTADGNLTIATNQFTVNAATGAASFNGNVVIEGSLTTKGASYQLSGASELSGPLISLHTGVLTNNDNFDIGVFYNYYDTSSKSGWFGRKNASGYLEYLVDTSVAGGVFTGTYGTIKAGSFLSTGNSIVQGGLAIGNITTPSGNLHISTDSTASVFFDRYGSAPPNMIFRRANGTLASPTAVALDNQLFALGGRGYGTSGYSSSGRAAVYAAAGETWTDSAQGAYLGFTTTPTGSATAATVLRLETTGQAFFSANIASTDSTTGTVKVTGGVGISGNLNVGGNISGTINATSPVFATSVTTSSTSLDVFNTTATTINFGGAATTLNMGNVAGTVTVAGALTVNGAFTESSSITLKENIMPITGALALIKQLEGVTYDRRNGSSKNEAGLIAERVDEILPNLVKHNSQGRAEGVNYTKLTAYLIEAVKELSAKIEELAKK